MYDEKDELKEGHLFFRFLVDSFFLGIILVKAIIGLQQLVKLLSIFIKNTGNSGWRNYVINTVAAAFRKAENTSLRGKF